MRRALSFSVLLIALSGCVAAGPQDNPFTRNFTWISYVAAEDLRSGCLPGAPDRWRFIYNGIYEEQVRFYDMDLDRGPGGGAILQSRVKGRGDLLNFNLFDPLQPWSGPYNQRYLSREQWLELDNALGQSGFATPTKAGTRLRSDNFYWVAAACRAGRFYFHAWQQPEDNLNALPFVPVVLAYDGTGVPYNAPRRLYLGPFGNVSSGQLNPTSEFQLTIGSNGLVQTF